jgi:hypothetical protein
MVDMDLRNVGRNGMKQEPSRGTFNQRKNLKKKKKPELLLDTCMYTDGRLDRNA